MYVSSPENSGTVGDAHRKYSGVPARSQGYTTSGIRV